MDFKYGHKCSGGEEPSSLSAVTIITKKQVQMFCSNATSTDLDLTVYGSSHLISNGKSHRNVVESEVIHFQTE